MTPACPGRILAALGVAIAVSSGGLAAQTPAEGPQGWLGVLVAPPRPAEDAGPDAAAPAGALVVGVVESSPAETVRLRAKDRIVAMDGVAISSPADLTSRLRKLSPGTWVSFAVQRGKSDLDVRVRLDERPAHTQGLKFRRGWIGVAAIDLPPSLRTFFGSPEDAGVLVSHVEPGGPAYAAGLRIGDVVYEVDGEPVGSSGALSRLVGLAGVDNPVEIRLMRNGSEIALSPVADRMPEK